MSEKEFAEKFGKVVSLYVRGMITHVELKGEWASLIVGLEESPLRERAVDVWWALQSV